MFNTKHQLETHESSKNTDTPVHSSQNSQKSSPVIMQRPFATASVKQSTPNLAPENKVRRFSFDRSLFSLRSSPRTTKKDNDNNEKTANDDTKSKNFKNGSKTLGRKSTQQMNTLNIDQFPSSKPKMTRSMSIEHCMSRLGSNLKLSRQDMVDTSDTNVADMDQKSQSARQQRFQSMQLIAQSLDNESIVISHYDDSPDCSSENQDSQDKIGSSPSSL